MTPEAFEELLWRASPAKFVDAVNPLDEKSRKAMRAVAKSVEKEVKKKFDAAMSDISLADWKRRKVALEKWRAKNPHVESNVKLAMLACGTAADAHRVEIWRLRWEHGPLIASVLIARNPSWLDNWVAKKLSGEFSDLSWDTVLAMVDAGVIEKPAAEGYMTLFIEAHRGYRHNNVAAYVPTSERLLARPEFLEDEIWRIFEFENHALTTDWSARGQGAPDNYETWPIALIRLANDGHIDRGRLLDVTVRSMQQEMKQNQLGAFGKLHDALKPDADEMKAREQDYRDLLVSPVGPVLTFAVKMLGKLHRSGKLDGAAFLDSVHAIFSHKAKGVALQALKIADKLAADDSLRLKSMRVAIAALSHKSPDVQDSALRLLERDFEHADAAIREDLERQVPFIVAKLQPRANALLGEQHEVSQGPEPEPVVDTDDVESLPKPLRTLTGIDGPVLKTMPAPLRFELLDLPQVVNRQHLQRVDSAESLLELAAQLIERVAAPGDVEVLFDGIARLGQDRSGDFEKLSAPLQQRVTTGYTSVDGLCASGGAATVAIIDLLMSWWTRRRYDSRRVRYFDESPHERFAAARVRELQAMLLLGESAPLLSTPTWVDGWIDPEDLVERIGHANDSRLKVRKYDLMQALLRLGPGARKRALEAAATLPGDTGRLVRFALGGDELPGRRDRKHADLWLCAGRARQPSGSLEASLRAIASKIPALPGTLDTGEWTWTVETTRKENHRHSQVVFDERQITKIDESYFFRRNLMQKVVKNVKKRLADPGWQNWPTAARRTRPTLGWYAMYHYGAEWRVLWMAMEQPGDTESFMNMAARLLDTRGDQDTSRDTPVHTFLAALFDPTRPWGDMVVLAVCLGLLSRSTDSRGFAVDALVPAVESGHADAAEFASTFARLLDDNAYKVNRIKPAMLAIAEVSSLHRWWVASVVDGTIAQLKTPPKAMYFLFDVALECLVPLALTPSEDVTKRLAKYKGSSKTARLARELLAIEGSPVHEPGGTIISAAWQGRASFARQLVGRSMQSMAGSD